MNISSKRIITELPSLQVVANYYQEAALDFSDIGFVCVQHYMYTTVDLFKTLLAFGANAENIFLLGKHYSYCPTVKEALTSLGITCVPLTPLKHLGEYEAVFVNDVRRLWKNFSDHCQQNKIRKIIVLDDGARCLENIAPGIGKFNMIGIEQTTAGIRSHLDNSLAIPTINVARCAAKKVLEAKIIAKTLVNKINRIITASPKPAEIGVIGVGIIGKSVLEQLSEQAPSVVIYDRNANALKDIDFPKELKCQSLDHLFSRANIVLSCVGKDIFSGEDINALFKHNTTLISCSSEDKEFISLLNIIERSNKVSNQHCDPLSTIYYQTKQGHAIKIISGGFPVNFDNSGESVPQNEIQLTRGLLLAAIFQAALIFNEEQSLQNTTLLKLTPRVQQFIVLDWLSRLGTELYQHEEINLFSSIEKIIKCSEGDVLEEKSDGKREHG